MCINISMSIIEKVFHYEETELSVIKYKDDIWFRGKTIAEILGYSYPLKAIRKHIDSEDKSEISELEQKSRSAHFGHPFKDRQRGTIYVNKSGVYCLILHSKLESGCVFKQWVMKEVLPSIRKTGKYDYSMNHKYNETLTFKIENETDLHVKVVSFLKKRFPDSLFSATLGENQCTSAIRIDSHNIGYLCGSLDLIINNLHKHYTGFAIEFNNPNGKGILSSDQSMML